jgi:hypothetical protein
MITLLAGTVIRVDLTTWRGELLKARALIGTAPARQSVQ